MEVTSLAIPEVLLVKPVRHGDSRGFFSETYNRRAFEAAGINGEFIQDNHSLSGAKGVIRGLHYQLPPFAQGKLVRVIRGAILDVAVDIRRSSSTFGKFVEAELTADNGHQLWIPLGFAHGFCTLVPNTEVIYKVTAYYAPAHDRGIFWNDPDIGITWPLDGAEPGLSKKDTEHPRLRDAVDLF